MAYRLHIQNIIAVTIFLSNEKGRLEESKVKFGQMFVLWQFAKSRLKLRFYNNLKLVISGEKSYKASTICVSNDHFIYIDLTKFYSCDFVIRDKVQL